MTRARPFSTGSPCYQENGTEGDQYEAGPIRCKSKATTTLPRLQCVTLRRRPPSAEPPVPDRLSCHVHHSAKNKECTKQDDKHSRLPVVSATRIQASFASTPPISSTETGLGQHPTRQRPRSSGEKSEAQAGAGILNQGAEKGAPAGQTNSGCRREFRASREGNTKRGPTPRDDGRGRELRRARRPTHARRIGEQLRFTGRVPAVARGHNGKGPAPGDQSEARDRS
jgi:hypothetical protein